MFDRLLSVLSRSPAPAASGLVDWRALFDDWLRYASFSSDMPLFSPAEIEWYLGEYRSSTHTGNT